MALENVIRIEKGYVSKGSRRRNERLELWGWILFVVSALFFIVASLRTGDVVGLLGGVFFFLACVVFLAAFRERGGRGKG
jgi:F0F1-type ATP synthase assembly protein I